MRNVSTATPSAVAHSAWDKPSCVRISLRAEEDLAIGHDDVVSKNPIRGLESDPSGCGLAWPLTLTAARTTSSFESATERACRTPAPHLRPNVNFPATVADWHILITHEPYNTGSSPGTKKHPSRQSQPRVVRHRRHHPRWLYVLAGATPDDVRRRRCITDETLEPIDAATVQPGDIVGIGIHTGNALRGYEIGAMARACGRVRGLRRDPRDALSRGGARARRRACRRQGRRRRASGRTALTTARAARLQPVYEGGRVEADAVQSGALGSACRRPIHVGVGADRARLSEALLVLLGVADRRPAAASARRPTRRRRNRRAAPARVSGSSRSPTTTSIR